MKAGEQDERAVSTSAIELETSFIARMEFCADRVGSVSALAKEAGISQSGIRRYFTGGEPTRPHLVNMARAARVSVTWLVSGEGSPDQGAREAAKSASPTGDGEEVGENFALVTWYDVEASAGPGRAVDSEAEIGKLAFRRDWLRQKGLREKDLGIIRVVGDSMAPTIRDGSLVLLDTSRVHARTDGIYALQVDGQLIAKRLQVDLAAGGLYIRSDNPIYETLHLTADQAADLHIVGRVVWAGGEL